MTDPFVTLQDLEDYLGRDLSDSPGGTAAVEMACDVCRDVSEQMFTMGTTTEVLDGTGSDVLLLPERPVNTVGTVMVNGAAVTDFEFTPNGLLFRGTAGSDPRPSWPAGRQNVRVTYAHGYDTLEVPGAVRQVALDLAARRLIQGPGATSESLQGIAVSYGTRASELSTNELRILGRYRRRSSGY